MNKTITKSLILLLIYNIQFGYAQQIKKVNYTKVEINKVAAQFIGSPQIQSKEYKVFQIDINTLKSQLDGIANRENDNSGFVAQLEFPQPDGSMRTYNAKGNNTMHPDLAAKFSEIKSYDAVDIETGDVVKWDITPQGLHAMIMVNGGSTIFIDPLIKGNTEYYIVYKKADFYTDKVMECTFNSELNELKNQKEPTSGVVKSFGSCEFRSYRLALAATREYTTFQGGTLALAQAAQVTTMNRVNGIYERDMAITMVIVANNNLIVFVGSDSYTNGNASAMISENQSIIDNAIGNGNYDIGHVFGTNSGGLAGLGVVCNNSQKARGVTGSSSPNGDTFDIDYVAHEMGHQFGCEHTFNNSCSGNRNNATAVEPGSGSTIMAYAGICSPNVQNYSDDHFHGISLESMGTEILSGGHTCESITALSNAAPILLSTNAGVTVPGGTPFVLTAVANDPNGDVMTYNWEQMDSQISTQSPLATSTNGPNFRSYSSSTSPSRYFPRLQTLNSNGPFTWEMLPTVSRTMNFRVSIRDNAVGGGCNDHTDVTLTVDGNSGPFIVTYPSVAGIVWGGNTNETVTWDVANTNNAPVNCSTVDILISTDAGTTYPTVLASNVPNTGSYAVVVPNVSTTVARIMVISNNGTFFDISDRNFKITQTSAGLNESDELNEVVIYPNPASEQITMEWKGEMTSVRLTDSKGKILNVVNNPNGETLQINVADYSSGIYYVHLQNQFGTSVRNLVIQ